MEADNIIEAFTQVVKEQDYVFSPAAIADIAILQQNLAALKNITPDAIAEVIRQWYLNHTDVRDAVLVQDREIKKVAKPKAQNQENILENRYRVLQEELQNLQNKKRANN
ncbi:hypothetical protein WA1_35625 [Scytonema hofmannii PCC 7110]|uniref:Uncharacterized protein n=1 Tax=Scytonema hofmannii PCC 7110 TaxID=128403 RepID=A0A139X1D4_9CYAN|nr:hypothetical protein [Scytonema hofmannii]KYC38521.1 hypothetical protein WA1_35625 [Scytonema hofmannii PCC 7110]